MKDIRYYSLEEFADFTSKVISVDKGSEFIILKGHILIEYCLNCYLESISRSDKANFFDRSYSFNRKLNLYRHFSPINCRKLAVIKSLKLINEERNRIAHNLVYKGTENERIIECVKLLILQHGKYVKEQFYPQLPLVHINVDEEAYKQLDIELMGFDEMLKELETVEDAEKRNNFVLMLFCSLLSCVLFSAYHINKEFKEDGVLF